MAKKFTLKKAAAPKKAPAPKKAAAPKKAPAPPKKAPVSKKETTSKASTSNIEALASTAKKNIEAHATGIEVFDLEEYKASTRDTSHSRSFSVHSPSLL